MATAARRQTKAGGGEETQEKPARCQSLKPEKEDRCQYKKWKVSHGRNNARIRKLGTVESAVTDHKFERVVDIEPTQDCITSTIKHHLIIQDEYLSSIICARDFISFFFSSFAPHSLCRFREGEGEQELCWDSRHIHAWHRWGRSVSRVPGWVYAVIWVVSCPFRATFSTRCWLGKL